MTVVRIAKPCLAPRLVVACAAFLSAVAIGGCTSAHGRAPSPASDTTPTKASSPTSSAKPPTADVEVEANKAEVAARLQKNTIAHIVLPPVDEHNGQSTTYEIQPAGTDVLKAVPNFPGYFKGTAGGTATVVVRQQPPCAAGKSCAENPSEIGSVLLTITGT